MYQPTVSVIINTYNRCHHLKRLLDCLARQSYENFEVVVVDGPSTDDTETMLETYRDAIRLEHCDEVNLCKSRNIGICAAAGEIVAFIDDDAVPENKDWIKNAVRHFEDKQVGIVGGAVYRINGDIEFQYGRCSILGENQSVNAAANDTHDDIWYPRATGGNMFMRREAVEKAGGFDEYFAYYLDESDLHIRLQMNGYSTVYCKDSAIIHEAARGAFRKSEFDLKWDVIARSQGYFVTKFTENSGKSKKEREEIAYESGRHWLNEFSTLCSGGRITKEEKKRYSQMVDTGLKQGIADAFARDRILNFDISSQPEQFKPYRKDISDGKLNICFFCEHSIINPIGGTGTHTRALAYGLAKRGHNVYVITLGEQELLNNEDGVNICSIVPEPLDLASLIGKPNAQVRLDFSYACFVKLQQLKKSFYIDVAETPIWDSYGVVTAYLEKEVPLATRLQTPLKMVMETFQKEDSADLDLLMQYEAALFEKSDAIIAISDCIKDTIENLYEMKFPQPVYKNYLGIVPDVKAVSSRDSDGKLVVFFIGRLERRKGIDSIIAALPALMEKYPNLEVRLAGDNTIYDDIIGDTYQHKLLADNKGAKWLKRVHFLGKISDEQKEQEFADCDVFVSPSLYESFGIIFIEAMRYAKPVIGCKTGGMQEVIADGETGLLCRPGDADSFRECLDRLLSDAALRRKLGEAGLARLNEMFSEETMCRRCEEIYREMIKK